jgi:hypothetical protein
MLSWLMALVCGPMAMAGGQLETVEAIDRIATKNLDTAGQFNRALSNNENSPGIGFEQLLSTIGSTSGFNPPRVRDTRQWHPRPHPPWTFRSPGWLQSQRRKNRRRCA